MNSKDFYKSPVGFGSFTPDEVKKWNNPTAQVNGKWILARPVPFISLIERLKQAWDVLTYKADALYWGPRNNQNINLNQGKQK